MTIRVVVADDQEQVRDGLSMLLAAESDLEVVALAADGVEAVEAVRRERPDVVVMDIRMPRMDGIEATRQITAEGERGGGDADGVTTVLVLTTFDHDDALYGALRAGASGYMLKEAVPTRIGDAVRRVADGGSWIDPGVAGKVIETLRETAPRDPSGLPSLEMLSPRELEVLTLMGDAPSNSDLAEQLFISEATVKTHISRLLMKTGSSERAQLVALAYRTGLVQP
ncbi:response regulator transcription factor [uncultured Serinicoccus sp.]|uniref:response regulator transcription factor n=1 Tax=uncultured Serinicoccus sp. TaxID=735514 RepID=UPI00262195B6|nr:response regulator transcription factor [uncultured Serinicoccus sp.]